MNSGSVELSIFVTLFLAAAAFVLIPAASTAMSKVPGYAKVDSSSSPEGTACELPPTVEIGKNSPAADYPLLDKQKTEHTKTATFAMG